jgi:hypothetical protein
MAELKDALELLTDRTYVLRTEGGMAQMRANAILVELQADGTDPEAARELARYALEELDGKYLWAHHTSTQLGGSGHPRHKRVDDFWVPVDKLRST